MAGPQRAFLLTALGPRWLMERGFRVGVSFRCPCQDAPYRLEVWFSNPLDGGTASTRRPLVWRSGDTFRDITLAQEGAELGEPLSFVDCGKLWVVSGEVYVASESEDDLGGGVPPSEGSA